MNTKLKLTNFVGIALLFGNLSLVGQTLNWLIVNGKDNSIERISLNDTRKLTFPTGNMLVTKNDKSEKIYPLSNIKFLNFEKNGTGVAEVLSGNKLKLYPNPVQNELRINIESSAFQLVQVSIYTLEGNLVSSTTTSVNGDLGINVSKLSTGIYICQLESESRTMIGKFVKK